MLNLARPGLSDRELHTYPLVLAWNHIHNYWVTKGIECEWIADIGEESEQDKEYYKPLNDMFKAVTEWKKKRGKS